MKDKTKPKAMPYDYQPVFSVTTQRIDKKGVLRGYNTYHVGIVTVKPCDNCEHDHIVFQDEQGCPYVRCHADQSAYQKYTDFSVEPALGWGPRDAKRALRYVLVATDKNGENERVSMRFLNLNKPEVQEICKAHLSDEQYRELIQYFEKVPTYIQD